MGNITIAFIFVMTINVLMFLTQVTMLELNPEPSIIFNCKGSLIGEFDANACDGEYLLDTSDDTLKDNLPTAESSISPTTGNVFTDMFSSIKTWIAEKTGLKYALQIVSAPYDMLKATGLPNDFVFAMGTFWYGISLFLLIIFIWGRE